MNTTELIAKIAEAHGVSKAQAKSIVEDIFEDIVDAKRRGSVAIGVRQVQSQGGARARRAQSG
jgi:nucleoid DNA-binding protein